MNYFLLFDNKNSDKEFITKHIGIPIITFYSPQSKKKIYCWLKGVFKVIFNSNKNDTIICWFDFQAILCFWICKILLLHRNIVCINLLLKYKSTLKNKIVRFLYKKALISKNFCASVTSEEYGTWINSKLGICIDYTLIHDVFHDSYQYNKILPQNKNTVFCGGYNGRDWSFIIQIAKKMPDITFNFIMPYNSYEKIKYEIPKNVNIKCNIPYDCFMEELCQSSIVCLPLNTESPAGLIVMFQAAANMKYILTTDTCTTREYLSDGKGALLPPDVNCWIGKINEVLSSQDACKESSKKLLNYLKRKCSEEEFIKNLRKMILKY